MPATRSLRLRIAGQTAMRDVVLAEQAAKPRTWFERMLGIRSLTPAARRSYDTALGDVVVGPVLEQLGQRWDVLHDVPLGDRRTIEHLAIGPGGVYAIRAVHCAGADVVIDGDVLTIGGVGRDDLVELGESAAVAEHLLDAASAPTTIRPVFVAVDAGRIVSRVAPERVLVTSPQHLRRTLTNGRPRLSGDSVAAISDAADREQTWPDGPDAPDDDTAALRREFAVIRDAVGTALRRRTGWAIAAFVVGTTSMCGAIAAYVTLVVLG